MNTKPKNWDQLTAKTDAEIIAWAEPQTWAREMADCMQDSTWHAEGDVWTHTKMVCDELTKLDQWNDLPRTSQLILLFTAIFHDAGKPATTAIDEQTGRVRSPKHAQVGMRIARRCLMELDCDLTIRESICHLILFHGRPPFIDKNADAGWELIKLSTYINHRLMFLFALADSRGRVCKSDDGRTEETLELWQLIALENNCFEQSYDFANDHARFLFYRGKLDNLHYCPHEDYRCQMAIMCGLPGAGKDSWLAENRPELPVVSLDEIRKELKVAPTGNQGVVIQAARERCKVYLRKGQDFAFNATNTTRQIRNLWVNVGAEYNARVCIVYIEPDFGTILDQNSGREARVPEKVIQRLIDKLDPPTLAECHELLVANRT